MKIIGKILIFIGIFIFLVSFFIIFTDKKKVQGYSMWIVVSESMKPTLNKGDLVICKEQTEYHKDDIVTFLGSKEEPVTHRIIEVLNQSDKKVYVTKGDNNSVKDPLFIENKAIKGKVIKKSSLAGHVVSFLKSVKGIILFVIIPSTILATLKIQEVVGQLDNKVFSKKK